MAKKDRPDSPVQDKAGAYVVTVQAERYYRGVRYFWTICGAEKPDVLISWGHAPTQEQAETAARNESEDLSAGLTLGGRVTSTVKAFTPNALSYRRHFHR